MNSLLRSLSLYLALFLAAPTFAILLSWNALPGESLYGVKRGLEEGPRFVFHLAGSKTAADYEVFVTDRRFVEAAKLIRTEDTRGLTELSSSIKVAETQVLETKNDTARDKFIDNLTVYNQKLEEQKIAFVQTTVPTPSPSTTTQPSAQVTGPTPIPTTAPTVPPTQPPPGPGPTPMSATMPPAQAQATAQAIAKTQDEIKKTIEELKKQKREEEQEQHNSKKPD